MAEYRYEIKSLLRNVALLLEELKEVWDRCDLDQKTTFTLYAAAEEAIVNAIKYGSRFNEDLLIELIFRTLDDRLELEVADQGEGFDYHRLPDPTLEDNITRLGGRGIFMIQHFMDKVEFLEGGRRIKMTKMINPKEGKDGNSQRG